MIALYIVLGILLLVLLLLFLPVTADLAYCGDLSYRFKYAGIVLFDSEKRVDIKRVKRKRKTKKAKKETSSASQKTEKERFFKKIYKEKGFAGSVKYFAEVLGLLLKKLWWVVKRFKFRRFKMDLIIATDDAANTAIEYGGICCAVYPVISLLESMADFKSKELNISADFDKTKPEFCASISVTTRLIFWLIAAVSALIEYYKIQHKESENNERKQH